MAMVEVAYELRSSASILVASEDEELVEGWPYDAVLKRFSPGLTPVDAAKAIVEEFENANKAKTYATLSAIALDQIDVLAGALDSLGVALLPVLSANSSTVTAARARTTEFATDGYIDVVDFVSRLKASFMAALPVGDNARAQITAAADSVLTATSAAVIATNRQPAAGADFRPHGIAIYMPINPINRDFLNLAFAERAPKWAQFVESYASMSK
jgi:hypothetical protein